MSFWCKLDFHSWEVIGWTVMGNPVEMCRRCEDAFQVTYGSINPSPHRLTAEQALEVIAYPDERAAARRNPKTLGQ